MDNTSTRDTDQPMSDAGAVFNGDVTTSPTVEQVREQQRAMTGAPAPTGQSVPMQPTGPAARWTDDDIERIRREEKDRLYPQLEEVKTQLQVLQEERETARRQAEEAETARLAAERAAEEEKMSARALVERRSEEWQQRFDDLQASIATERAVFDKERQYSALMEFKNAQLATVQDSIMPNLLKYIGGNNEQEILASIERAQQTTAEILGAVQEQQQQQWTGMRGTMPTQPASGPLESAQGARVYTAEDIEAMPMSEFIKQRGVLLPAAGRAYRAQQG